MKPLCLKRNADRAPSFELYRGIRLTTEEESRKHLSQGSRKVPAGHDSFSRNGGRSTGRLDSRNLRHV